MTKKICYVTTISGTMGFFERQLLFLAKKGFEVCVISSDDGRLPKEFAGVIRYIPIEIPRGIAFAKSVSLLFLAFYLLGLDEQSSLAHSPYSFPNTL